MIGKEDDSLTETSSIVLVGKDFFAALPPGHTFLFYDIR
jgi:hypothetical protein